MGACGGRFGEPVRRRIAMIRVVSTAEWKWDDIAAYGKDITAAFQKLVKRYPQDVTVESLFNDCVTGAKTLWLVLEDDELLAIVMTRVTTTPVGTKLLTACDAAGKGWRKWLDPLADVLEAHAGEIGAIPQWEGRFGWGKTAERRGYRVEAVLYRKVA